MFGFAFVVLALGTGVSSVVWVYWQGKIAYFKATGQKDRY